MLPAEEPHFDRGDHPVPCRYDTHCVLSQPEFGSTLSTSSIPGWRGFPPSPSCSDNRRIPMCPDIDLRANAASGAELALAMMMYLWLCAGCAENFPANSLEAAPMTQAHHSAIPADLESAVI